MLRGFTTITICSQSQIDRRLRAAVINEHPTPLQLRAWGSLSVAKTGGAVGERSNLPGKGPTSRQGARAHSGRSSRDRRGQGPEIPSHERRSDVAGGGDKACAELFLHRDPMDYLCIRLVDLLVSTANDRHFSRLLQIPAPLARPGHKVIILNIVLQPVRAHARRDCRALRTRA